MRTQWAMRRLALPHARVPEPEPKSSLPLRVIPCCSFFGFPRGAIAFLQSRPYTANCLGCPPDGISLSPQTVPVTQQANASPAFYRQPSPAQEITDLWLFPALCLRS